MSTIQILLIGATAFSLVIYQVYFRSLLRDRLIALAFFIVTVFFILVPNATTTIANYLGVGRGADLLIYVSVTAFIFMFILVYSRISKLERAQTELARYIAINNAKKGFNADREC
jgi:hypothetical protein